jgi:putative transposase
MACKIGRAAVRPDASRPRGWPIWTRQREGVMDFKDVVHQTDRGSQFTSVRYGERLAEIGAAPWIGTIEDSYDNALAETVNGYHKAELIYGPARTGPWKTVEDVELATLSWVYWHHTSRLHSHLGDVAPTGFEATFYDAPRTDQPLVAIPITLQRSQGDSRRSRSEACGSDDLSGVEPLKQRAIGALGPCPRHRTKMTPCVAGRGWSLLGHFGARRIRI